MFVDNWLSERGAGLILVSEGEQLLLQSPEKKLGRNRPVNKVRKNQQKQALTHRQVSLKGLILILMY
jgi:hypothetical protein